MNYKLSKFQIGIIVFIVSLYSIFATYTLFQNRPFTVKNISLQLVAILLIYFFIKIKIAVELLDNDLILAKGFLSKTTFLCKDVYSIKISRLTDTIIIKYKTGSIILLRKMKNINELVCKIQNNNPSVEIIKGYGIR
jgi:hypothetical protein